MTITQVGAVIWTTARVEEMLTFYRAIGIPLERDTHEVGEGPLHYEADVGGTHFAVFHAKSGDSSPRPVATSAAQPAESISSLPNDTATVIGLAVDDLESVIAVIDKLGAKVRIPLQDMDWGKRIVVEDPDGRVLEIYQPPPDMSF